MKTYNFQVLNQKTNKKSSMTVRANNQAEASRLVISRGLSPLRCSIQKKTFIQAPWKKVRTKDRVMFARQLATLLEAGLPLFTALQQLSDQTSSKTFKTVLKTIIRDVQNKGTLTQALSAHQGVFGDFFITLVEAGEKSGALELTLQKLAEQQEKDAENSRKLRGALIYPTIVLGVFIVIVIVMLINVIPIIESTYQETGRDLPFLTQALVGIADIIKNFWWLILISVLGFCVGISWWVKMTISGRNVFDIVKLRSPVFGKLFTQLCMARFCSITSLMLVSGVLLAETLETVARNVHNSHVEAAIMRTRLAAIKGHPMSSALKKEPLIPKDVISMIETGENSGQVGKMLGRMGTIYGQQVDNSIKNLMTVLTPFLTILIGGLVLFIVFAVFVPIMSLAGSSEAG